VSTPPIQILLVEDEESDYLVTKALFEQLDNPAVILSWVRSYHEALEVLQSQEYDLFLVDYILADGNGLDLVREATNQGVRAPMIMLTGKGSHEVDVEAMQAGASDYLVKGTIDPPLLERTIRYALERRRNREELRASEERLRTLFDRLPLGLYRITADGEFLDANPALVRLLAYPNREALSQVYSPQLYVRDGDQDRFRATLEADGVVLGFETSLKRRDGRVIHVRNSARVQRGPDGEVEYIEGTVEDVSEVARARSVTEAESHYRALVEAATLGVLVTGLDGTVEEANPAAGDIFGCPAEDLKGRTLIDLFDEGEGVEVALALSAVQKDPGGPVEADRRLRQVGGGLLWARVTFTTVRDPEGAPFHVLCLLEDVAETSEPA